VVAKKKSGVTPDAFRRLALACDGAVEGAHMGTADFRVHGKIFASLGSPDAGWGMVKLLPDEQRLLLETEPAAFKPAAGAWGRAGCTLVRLDAVDETTLHSAIVAAWRNIATQKPRRTARKRS
jgi:hypothetical protein